MTKNEYPKTIGRCIDMLYEQRAERLKLQKVVDNAKVEEAKLESYILDTFTKDELRGAKGDLATASVKRDTVVAVTDWDTFLAWAVQTEAYDVLRKQPSQTAVKARWDEHVDVPGVEPMVKVSLSLTRS